VPDNSISTYLFFRVVPKFLHWLLLHRKQDSIFIAQDSKDSPFTKRFSHSSAYLRIQFSLCEKAEESSYRDWRDSRPLAREEWQEED